MSSASAMTGKKYGDLKEGQGADSTLEEEQLEMEILRDVSAYE